MEREIVRGVKIFYCYSHKDKELKEEMVKHLGRSNIQGWDDREILAGEIWRDKLDENINSAEIILLLISVDFLASDYCYSIETKRALERHQAGEARVIPIILRPTHWKNESFSKLQVLPTGGKAITSWINKDEAFFDVAEGVHKVINDFLRDQYRVDARFYAANEDYELALAAYDQAILLSQRLVPFEGDASLYKNKGDILFKLRRYEEAVASYGEAIHLDDKNAQIYVDQGKALRSINRFSEALKVYNQAISLIGNDSSLYASKGDILLKLGSFDEALLMYEKAIQIDPDQAIYYKQKGDILLSLGRLEGPDNAIDAYEKAIQIDPDHSQFYVYKGNALFKKKVYTEALEAYDQALARDPKNTQTWRNKGKALFNATRLEDALVAYEQALLIEANNAYIYKEEGDILFNLGRLEEALVAYEDATRLKPDFGLAYLSMSIIFEELARKAYEKLKKRAEQALIKARQLGATK